MEAALRAHAAVAECAVVMREDGQPGLVAYVVPSSAVESSELAAIARAAAGDSPFTGLVQVSSLPLSASGEIDHQVLRDLELVDRDVARTWEQALSGLSGVRDAAVLVRDRSIKRSPLHLSDLVKDVSAAGANAPASQTTSEPVAGAPGVGLCAARPFARIRSGTERGSAPAFDLERIARTCRSRVSAGHDPVPG